MTAVDFAIAGKRVWVAGHRGMVGSALLRRLRSEDCELLTVERSALDLREQQGVRDWVRANRPDVVFMAAAVVGGIEANSSLPVDFLHDNLAIATNVIEAAFRNDVAKLVFLGSSCLYPRDAQQPVKESALLTGAPEPTNQWYAVGKIAGVKLCQAYRRQHGADFISVVPTNLYGPGDNYHPEHSHVPAALIRRFHEAKLERAPSVSVWGTGKPLREFMFADDLADACVFAARRYSEEGLLNIGTGREIAIADFARAVAEAVGYTGALHFDASRPDGAPRKLLDSSKLAALGWTARTDLRTGLAAAYEDYLAGGGRERAAGTPPERTARGWQKEHVR